MNKDKIFSFILIYHFIIYRSLNIFIYWPYIKLVNKIGMFFALILFLVKFKRELKIKAIEDIWLVLNMLYCFVSMTLYYFVFSGNTLLGGLDVFFAQFLVVIYPMVWFLVFKNLNDKQTKIFDKIMIGSILVLILLGFIMSLIYGKFHVIMDGIFLTTGGVGRFTSTVGVIELGFLCWLLCTAMLFRKDIVKGDLQQIVVFSLSFIGLIMTYQRAPIYGLCYSIFVFLIYKKFHINLKKTACSVFILTVGFMILSYLISVNGGDNIIDVFRERLGSLDLKTALNDRGDQQFIAHKHSLRMLFGSGMGKYTSRNKMVEFAQSDAVYFKVLNERGIIGSILFWGWWIFVLTKQIRNRNIFIFVIISYFLLYTGVSNVLEGIPGIFMIYAMVGGSLNNAKLEKEKERKTCR